MQKISETIEDFFKNVDLSPYSGADFENMTNMLNHWVQNEVGRAKINIPSSALITQDWVRSNVSHIQRLVKVRNKCKQCSVENPKKCPFDEENRERVRKYEREEGLDKGTINANVLLTHVCVENCDKPGSKGPSPVYRDMLMRPSLVYRHETIYYAYEACPVKGKTFQK